ncbi:MAG: hypothetical protein SFW67_35710 [Myxococcaceae bacterium]|nr:hypothetical protein [Myxococcaceae bacterium]
MGIDAAVRAIPTCTRASSRGAATFDLVTQKSIETVQPGCDVTFLKSRAVRLSARRRR